MGGKGTLTISTHREGDWVVVDLVDSGPGIPAKVRDKLFSPFFTTKPFGQGTGLGLNISFNIVQKHSGAIRVFSVPGKTRFSVRLPISWQEDGPRADLRGPIDPLPDDRLAEILRSTKTVAVVGISGREGLPAHSVPKYLHDHGYDILPICADCGRILGADSYPDLSSVPVPVDLVLVCSRHVSALDLVDQAVAIGAPVVWLQEGIADADAAERAREAGLQIVMDTCIRLTHQRLVRG
jgi:predicted CoA-binding protein